MPTYVPVGDEPLTAEQIAARIVTVVFRDDENDLALVEVRYPGHLVISWQRVRASALPDLVPHPSVRVNRYVAIRPRVVPADPLDADQVRAARACERHLWDLEDNKRRLGESLYNDTARKAFGLEQLPPQEEDGIGRR